MRALPPATVALLAASLIACGDGEVAIDAGPADARLPDGRTSCAFIDGGIEPRLGLLLRVGACVSCGEWADGEQTDEQGDVACAAEYGEAVPDSCRAYCREGSCWRYCPDQCTGGPEVDACEPGQGACIEPLQPTYVYVCDPTCQPAGGCRGCIDDADCEAELGPGAYCQRHCAYCCNETAGDASVRCVCA